jgi:RHS repeat-associated protein
MAVFFVKARGEQPVANNLCNPNQLRFTDVPCNYNDGLANGWGYIEQFAIDGITAGCGVSLYCPTVDTTEVQMVAFLQRSWNAYFPVPRGTIYSFRDLDGQVVTEYRSWAGGVSAPGSYPIASVAARDNVFLGRLLVGSNVSDTQAGALGWYYYTSDHLGSPRLVTNASHQTVESRKYWPYGQDTGLGNPVSLQSIRFAAMELDDDGQHYNDHARGYDLGTVRFVEPDPLLGAIELPRTWNRYNYVLGNPVVLIDPRGYKAPFCYDVPNADNEGTHEVCWAWPSSYGPGIGGNTNSPGDPGGNGKNPCTATPTSAGTSIVAANLTTNVPSVYAGGVVGLEFGGLWGGLAGAILGSFINIGGNVSVVRSTRSVYIGPTLSISPPGPSPVSYSGAIVPVPYSQNANSIASGLSYSFSFQPSLFAGSTVIKSPNNPAVVGFSGGSRFPVSVGASAGICIKNCGC